MQFHAWVVVNNSDQGADYLEEVPSEGDVTLTFWRTHAAGFTRTGLRSWRMVRNVNARNVLIGRGMLIECRWGLVVRGRFAMSRWSQLASTVLQMKERSVWVLHGPIDVGTAIGVPDGVIATIVAPALRYSRRTG